MSPKQNDLEEKNIQVKVKAGASRCKSAIGRMGRRMTESKPKY